MVLRGSDGAPVARLPIRDGARTAVWGRRVGGGGRRGTGRVGRVFVVLSVHFFQPDGGERQSCYPHNTCNAGLICLRNLCVKPPDGGGFGGSGAAGSTAGAGAADLTPALVHLGCESDG
jgi:hypothetical protein